MDTSPPRKPVAAAYSWIQGRRWNESGARLFPGTQDVFEEDLSGLIREWVIPGHAPPAGMLSADDSIVTLGSCFARELRDYLAAAGLSAASFWIPAGLNNTFAILDFVSWCVSGQETGRGVPVRPRRGGARSGSGHPRRSGKSTGHLHAQSSQAPVPETNLAANSE